MKIKFHNLISLPDTQSPQDLILFCGLELLESAEVQLKWL